MAVLKSCSAYEAYRRFYAASLDAWRICEFLVFSEVFPRSIRFSVDRAAEALHEVGGGGVAGSSARRAERVLGQLRSSLDYGTVDDLQAAGMQRYLDDVQRRLNRVSEELHAAYFLFDPVLAQGLQGAAQQQVQQTQQQ
jgi:uncharacterized alpha-E superfamily protein